MNHEVEEPTFLGFGLNRIVAFVGPQIAWIGGAVATWLMGQTDIFATFDVSNESLAGAISQALTFGVVTFVIWLGQHKWLDGFQKWAYQSAQAVAKVELPPGAVPVVASSSAPVTRIVPGPDDAIDEETGMPPGVTPEAMEGFDQGDPPVAG